MICRGGIHSRRKSTDPPGCPERKEAFPREGGHTMNNDLINRIKKHAPRFSKGQRAIANFLITNYEKAAFMTASKLGEVAGVSESTVVRFAVAIGFEGYPELQAALQELIRMRLTPVQRMEVTNDRIGNGDVLESVLNSDISKIRSTLETVSHADFDSAVEALMHARKIYIIGMRSSAILASFLAFNFRFMFEHVSLVQTTSGSEVFEQLLRVSEDDAVIAISFPRYSKRIVKRRGSCPQLAVSGRGIVKRVVREHQRLSVMRKQAEEAVLKRVIALFLKQAQRQELALRLRHFSVRGVEVQDMEPEIAPPVPDISLGLCNLVRVVREGIVHPATVNVKIFAAVFEGNGRALDMPAGISHSPRAVPFQLLIVELRFREPERKIGGIALVRVLSDALSHTDLKVVGIVLAENIVLFQL